MSPSDSDPGPSYGGRRDPTDDDENYGTASGNDDDDDDGRSNASENMDDVEYRDHHPTEGGGYTPLDFNMNEMVPMDEADSDDYSDDDGDDGRFIG